MQFCRVFSHPLRDGSLGGRKDFLSRSLVTEVFTTEAPNNRGLQQFPNATYGACVHLSIAFKTMRLFHNCVCEQFWCSKPYG